MKPGKTRITIGSALLAATLLLGGGAANAQTAPAAQPIRDQRALDLLKTMSLTLASAKSLSVEVRGLIPFAAPTGQYVSLFASSHVVLQRPDKLFVKSRGDLFPNDLYFDGKTVTTIGLDRTFYTQKESSGSTIDALLQKAHPGSDALAQFADILVSDPYAALTADLASAIWVGQSAIGGLMADHLAFTGKELDWEIWIGTRDALPVLMVISHRQGERQPTFTVQFSDWKLKARTSDKTFKAPIPKDAVKLDFKLQDLAQPK
jgi:hypothetical protein